MLTEFRTEDILLAAYLFSKNIPVVEAKLIDSYRCEFKFNNVPKEHLNYWLTQGGQERTLLNAYKHVLRLARESRKAGGGQ